MATTKVFSFTTMTNLVVNAVAKDIDEAMAVFAMK